MSTALIGLVVEALNINLRGSPSEPQTAVIEGSWIGRSTLKLRQEPDIQLFLNFSRNLPIQLIIR